MHMDFMQASLSRFVALSAPECEAVRLMQADRRSYRARAEIRALGDPCREIFILRRGWALESRILKGGRRQVTHVHLPGDVIGISELTAPVSGSEILAATGVEVAAVLKPAFGAFMARHSRLAAAWMLMNSRRTRDDDEWLCAVGRMNVEERLQLFLLTLHERLSRIGMTRGSTFDLLLNQSDIGDRCGMTSVSVSKGMQELRSRKLIYMSGREVTLLEIEKMRANTDRVDPEIAIDTRWIEEIAATGDIDMPSPVRPVDASVSR